MFDLESHAQESSSPDTCIYLFLMVNKLHKLDRKLGGSSWLLLMAELQHTRSLIGSLNHFR
jgi:hypothetical protein